MHYDQESSSSIDDNDNKSESIEELEQDEPEDDSFTYKRGQSLKNDGKDQDGAEFFEEDYQYVDNY